MCWIVSVECASKCAERASVRAAFTYIMSDGVYLEGWIWLFRFDGSYQIGDIQSYISKRMEMHILLLMKSRKMGFQVTREPNLQTHFQNPR